MCKCSLKTTSKENDNLQKSIDVYLYLSILSRKKGICKENKLTY